MEKALLSLLVFCGYSICSIAQSGLYITAGTSLSVQTATPFSVDGLVLQPATPFSLNGHNSLERKTVVRHAAPQAAVQRVYQFATTIASYSGDIIFYYEDPECNGIPENALTLNTHNGSAWQYHAANHRDAIDNAVYSYGLTGLALNELTLAHWLSPLPLKWGPVRVLRQSDGASVQWQTQNEDGVATFQVEKSLDGRNWMPVGNTTPAHNTPGIHDYDFKDVSITAALTYYRIRQTDADSKINYSKVVVLHAHYTSEGMIAFPNPVKSTLQVQASKELFVSIKLYDTNGRLLRQYRLPKISSCTLDIARLPNGAYILEAIMTNGTTLRKQILKH